jgi:F-type H+-transporting ATPase subunit delta
VPTAIISSSARRYAAAAYGVASEAGEVDTWLAALDRVASLMDNATVRAALTSPVVKPDEKRSVLAELAGTASQYLRNFLAILVDRNRVRFIPEIAQAFRDQVYQERHVLTAEVTTAVPLDPQSQQTVAQRLGDYLHHDPQRLVIESRVDPNIIGGVVARVGDTLIDDSVRGRLERLRRSIATQ